MANTQAPIEMDLYMEFPHGIETTEGNAKDYVLKLLANICGQKQARRVWNQYLRDDIIFIMYPDDGIISGTSNDQLSHVIKELMDIGLQIENESHQVYDVGVIMKCPLDGSYKFSQSTLLDSIITNVGLTPHVFTMPVPAKYLPPFQEDLNNRSAIGKLNYLGQRSCPDIQYMTHAVAKNSSNPRQEHGHSMIYLARYLIKTCDLGLNFKPDILKGFYCYADADFSRKWNKRFAELDPCTAKSRSGWFILYASCLNDLSTIEAKYSSLISSSWCHTYHDPIRGNEGVPLSSHL
ncbi:hypothetical protein ACHAW6_001765 [Cyclotella cf. meneghiniana]